jgi:hypothetical protein
MSSLGTWPAAFLPASCRFMVNTNQRVNASPGGGSEQVVDMLNDRWLISLTLPRELNANAAAVEAFLNSFRGQVNTINLWHFARSAPRGTMRGAPTLSANVEQGADSLPITTEAGATLKAGDMLGVGGLLIMVKSDCTADGGGALVAPIVNRVRTALASGAVVTWDKPTVACRLLSHSGVSYSAAISEEVSMSLGEAV